MEVPGRLISGLHARGHLPHLKRAGASYFITFRLHDSLPAVAIEKLKEERERIARQAVAHKRPLTWTEEQELFRWYADQVDAFLDAGAGECWLKHPEIADVIAGALRFFDGDRYELGAWVVMSNHVHVIVRPLGHHSLSRVLQSWKSYTAHEANRLLLRDGPFWQKESYDHIIRDDDERVALSNYIRNNPVRAKICERPEDWKWSSAWSESP